MWPTLIKLPFSVPAALCACLYVCVCVPASCAYVYEVACVCVCGTFKRLSAIKTNLIYVIFSKCLHQFQFQA